MTPTHPGAPSTATLVGFLVFAVATAAACAQARDAAAADRGAAVPGAQVPEGAGDEIPVLPEWMIPVPRGTVDLGMDAKTLIEIEEKAFPYSEKQRLSDMTLLMSELGVRKGVPIEPFLLAQFPVTNAQYKVFVEKTGHRFPFHWWKDGKPDDYESRLAQIDQELPDDVGLKPLVWWQRNWKDLPWAIPTDKPPGERETTMDDYPVVYVSWEDAIAFAAWAGMRLPTEPEWVYAARGSEPKQYLWGDDPSGPSDIKRGTRFDRIWPVGKFGAATTGPFGHGDMVLGVWEWTGELGFFPYIEQVDFKRERDKLLREKLLRDQDNSDVKAVHKHWPEWRGDKVAAKGGMWSSMKTQLRIETRAPLETIQTVSAVGFRVAKSFEPARDLAASRVKLDYDYSYFGGDRKPNLTDQTGIERYDFNADGLIEGYHALSLVPVNWATEDSKINLQKLKTETIDKNRPLAIATLVATIPIEEPKIEPGIYTLLFRNMGMPDDLKRALPPARKAIKTLKEGQELDRGDWGPVLNKYRITDEEAAEGGVDFIRLMPGELKVPVDDQHSLLLRDYKGDYIQSWPIRKSLETRPNYEPGDAIVTVEAGKDDGEIVTFEFGVPVQPKAKGRVYKFEVPLRLSKDWAGGDGWRLPVARPR